MIRRLTLIAVAFLLALASAAGHDLWLVPGEADVGKPVEVQVAVGMKFPESEQAPNSKNFLKRDLIKPDGSEAELAALEPRGEVGLLTFTPATEGIYQVAVQTRARIIELSAERFNNYLVSDGLPHIYQLRAKENTLGKDAKERYSKSPKALIRVGPKAKGASPRLPGDPCKSLGLTLEIVPRQDPFSLRPGSALKVLVLFQGKPLVDANLGWDHPGEGEPPRGTARTDKAGEALIPLARPGLISIRLTHMTRPQHADYEWESFWTTLTFRVQD